MDMVEHTVVWHEQRITLERTSCIQNSTLLQHTTPMSVAVHELVVTYCYNYQYDICYFSNKCILLDLIFMETIQLHGHQNITC